MSEELAVSGAPGHGFAAGNFFCRMLPNEDAVFEYIDDPLWEDDAVALMDFSFELPHQLGAAVAAVFGDTNRIGSWFLARLWQLTNGAPRNLLENVDENGVGMGDGGYLLLWLLIEQEGRGVACVGFEVDSGVWHVDGTFAQTLMARLTLRSAGFDLDAFIAALTTTLCTQPRDLAICRVDVQNPEENCFPYAYGWDGQRLLGDDDPPLRELLARRQNPDPTIRAESFDALMQLCPPNMYDLLQFSKDDPAPEVRERVARYLDTLGGQQHNKGTA